MDAKLIRKVKRRDKIARWVITSGGMLIILCVVGIFFLIASVAAPLFFSPQYEKSAILQLPPEIYNSGILAVGTDEYLEYGFTFNTGAQLRFAPFNQKAGSPETVQLEHPAGGTPALASVEMAGKLDYSLTWEDGWSSLERLRFAPKFDDQAARTLGWELTRVTAIAPTPGQATPLVTQVRFDEERGATRVALLPGNKISVTQVFREETLLGDVNEETFHLLLSDPIPGEVSVFTLDESGKSLYVGTRNGHLLKWDLSEPGEPHQKENLLAFQDRRAISAISMVLGETSIAVGDERGGLTVWFLVTGNQAGNGKALRRVHTLDRRDAAVMKIYPSRNTRSLVSLTADGTIHFDHITNTKHLLSITNDRPVLAMGLSSRFNGVVGWDGQGQATLWKVEIPHPEASWSTYFGKLWYESYDKPAYVWQSSAGADDYEPKLSLIPLIFGTIKATFYGMLFAVPLAILGAMYTSHLMHPGMRKIVKPAIEIMGSVPSVVIGFLAALWLAPLLKVTLVGVLLLAGLMPVLGLGASLTWETLSARFPTRMPTRGYEFLVFLPLLGLLAWASIALGGVLEIWWFNGNFTEWLTGSLNTAYDQRNSIVIAFALGFAVLPIIFTIADDALTNVPRNLTAASLALGASRWQTVWRVVLPSASPGIFAAVMVGFGRAIGETMIVLMATGNTPIMDWVPVNGMRTLSANIAVEAPEAPVGGTLYRTLFLSALLLFMVTFVLNSAAEVVRQRLRKKYGRY